MNENKEKTAGNLANSVVEGYDYSVAVRMSGRAGAYSPTGGKGNAFEVMYSDKKNLSNLLKPDTTTTLTNSSTARQVDLVTKKGNRIIERIQCKDTPSAKGTMDTIKRVQNGQYRTTQLVGTSESAAAFNAKAPSQGVTKVMKDSGISTKDTTRVSNKFNCPSGRFGYEEGKSHYREDSVQGYSECKRNDGYDQTGAKRSISNNAVSRNV